MKASRGFNGRRVAVVGAVALAASGAFARLDDDAAHLSAGNVVSAETVGLPKMMLRLNSRNTFKPGQWATALKSIAENPGCCDEVWFSTGVAFPKIEWHLEHARRLQTVSEDVRRLGIAPSLQIQVTIGHGDHIAAHEDISGKTWGSFTGPGGVEARTCNCPRQPAFLDYYRRLSAAYAEAKPSRVWIDDDLRVSNHLPAVDGSSVGCWCATCIAAFNAETGGTWTRQTLSAAIRQNRELAAQWRKFSTDSLCALARVIVGEFRRVSPETRFGYQFAFGDVPVVSEVLKTLHEAGGRPVGARLGGGVYYETNGAEAQIAKCFTAARGRRDLGDPGFVDLWCEETESWPRAYAARSGQNVLIEQMAAIACGMNALSYFVTDPDSEDDALYSRVILKPLAEAAPVLRGYLDDSRGTVPCGVTLPTTASGEIYQFARIGIPVLPGWGRGTKPLAKSDVPFFIYDKPSAVIQKRRDEIDRKAGGLPVKAESPFIGLVQPRVTDAGELRTVGVFNVRIDSQGPLTLSLRNLPAGVRTALWRELRRPELKLPVCRTATGASVTIPEISAWNAGYLSFSARD